MLGQSPLYAVKSGKAVKGAKNEQATKKLPAISPAVVAKFEKKAKHAIVFSAIGLALLIGVIATLAIGTTTWALPLLGLAGLFANIGFIKAMRLRQRTKSRKKTFRKARFRAKSAIILASVLGITLIFAILSLLLNKPDTF